SSRRPGGPLEVRKVSRNEGSMVENSSRVDHTVSVLISQQSYALDRQKCEPLVGTRTWASDRGGHDEWNRTTSRACYGLGRRGFHEATHRVSFACRLSVFVGPGQRQRPGEEGAR